MRKAIFHAALCLFMLIVSATSAYAQWIQTNWSASNSFFSLYSGQDKVFVRTWDSLNGGRVFFTANDGASWSQVASADNEIDILSIIRFNNTVLAGTWNGFYLSASDGTSWSVVTPAGIPADTAILSITMMSDAAIFAGATGHIYKSSDNGNNWSDVSSGIPANARITSIIANGNTVFAGSDSNGVFSTTNGGTSWTAINSGLTDTHIFQLATVGAKLFAVTLKGVFVSDNNGTTWAADSSSLRKINCFVAVNNQLFAGTDDKGVYLSVDSGKTWTSVSSGMPADTRIWSLAASSNDIFAGTSSGVWRMPMNASLVGDVNGNGNVDIVDALLIAQYYVGLNPSVFIASNADVNCSSTIDIIDALLIAQYYVGLISSFPC
jgi:photosystem II stability/assembly factor-like uncharacterized protein